MNSEKRDEGSDISESNETAFDSNKQTEPGDTAAAKPRSQDRSKASLTSRAIVKSTLSVTGVLGFIALAVVLVVTTLNDNDNEQHSSRMSVDIPKTNISPEMDGKKRGWHQKEENAKSKFGSKMDGKKRGWHQKRGFRRDFKRMTPQMKQKECNGLLTPRQGRRGAGAVGANGAWNGEMGIGPEGTIEPGIDFYSNPMLLDELLNSMLRSLALEELRSVTPDMLMELEGLEDPGEDTNGYLEQMEYLKGIIELIEKLETSFSETSLPFDELPEIAGELAESEAVDEGAPPVTSLPFDEESNTSEAVA